MVHFHVCIKSSDTFEKVWLTPRLQKKLCLCGYIYTNLASLTKHMKSAWKGLVILRNWKEMESLWIYLYKSSLSEETHAMSARKSHLFAWMSESSLKGGDNGQIKMISELISFNKFPQLIRWISDTPGRQSCGVRYKI